MLLYEAVGLKVNFLFSQPTLWKFGGSLTLAHHADLLCDLFTHFQRVYAIGEELLDHPGCTLHEFAYEGNGSRCQSLDELSFDDGEENLDFLQNLGPNFKALGGICQQHMGERKIQHWKHGAPKMMELFCSFFFTWGGWCGEDIQGIQKRDGKSKKSTVLFVYFCILVSYLDHGDEVETLRGCGIPVARTLWLTRRLASCQIFVGFGNAFCAQYMKNPRACRLEECKCNIHAGPLDCSHTPWPFLISSEGPCQLRGPFVFTWKKTCWIFFERSESYTQTFLPDTPQ